MSYRDHDPANPMRTPTPTGTHPTGDRSESPRNSVWGLVIGLVVLLVLLGLAMMAGPADERVTDDGVPADAVAPAMDEPAATAPAPAPEPAPAPAD